MTLNVDSPLTQRVVEPDRSNWDEWIGADSNSTFCHLWGWQEVMGAMGHECLYRVAVDAEGRYQGVLPLVRVRSRLMGHFLVSMPFLNYGGPVGTPAARRALAAWAAEEAGRSGADLLELRSREAVPGELRTSHRKITVLLNLPDSADALWSDGFPSKLRSQIRRPIKEGMEARFGPELVDAFYDVFARNMRDLGTPVLPRAFFERILDVLSGHVVIGAVYDGDRPVAAGWGFVMRNEFEITWASSLREYNRKAPNMLLYWSFMKEMIAREVGVFNFGRCTPGGGTHRFKLQWGGHDVPLPWAQWSSGPTDATPSPDRPIFRLATAAWRRIPLEVANRLGPVLARRIP